MIGIVFFSIPTLAAVVSLVFGGWWIARADRREAVLRRYPLRLLTWLMAAPAGLASFAALFFGTAFVLDDGSGNDGFGDALGLWPMAVLGLAGTAFAIVLIVQAHRVASTRRRSRPWLMPALAAAPILVVVWVAASTAVYDAVTAAAGLVLALGAASNALLASASARA